MRALHSRTASITWAPPLHSNGIIANYTLYLHPGSILSSDYKPSSVTNNNLTLIHNRVPNPSTLFSKEGAHLNSDSKSMTEFNLSNLPNNTGFNNGSSTIQNTVHILQNHFSTLLPRTLESGPTESSHQTSTSRDRTAVPFYPAELNSTRGNPHFLLSAAKLNSNGYDPDLFMKQDPFASPISSSVSAASRSTLTSVTVPGNITSYTFFNLLPYQIYSFQVRYLISVITF